MEEDPFWETDNQEFTFLFSEPEGSLLCPQHLAIGSYSDAKESNQ
jgi:hypothetical protein